MHPWAQKQLAPWAGHKVRSQDDLSSPLSRESGFFFRLENGIVHCDYKLTHLIFAQRAQKYHEFFNSIASRFTLPNIAFALDVGDEAPESRECPMFTFQRRRGGRNILLPDNDFVWTDCYSDRSYWCLPDPVAYDEKHDTAVFVGSTTGAGHITAAKLASGGVPRVEAARFFRGSKFVDFRLSNIVQCDEEALQIMRDEGFGKNPSGWPDQLTSKFLISIDGNGATCSRVYISLVSNSVLLKYKSDCEMFYFDGLEQGKHFLAIENHQDIIDIVQGEIKYPSRYAQVAKFGKEFAARYLSRGALEAYTADLFWAYADSI